jgi:(R,R)-butanediol dehydrogenase / meso-butanediol dehydrogenase / diacetyl reductase
MRVLNVHGVNDVRMDPIDPPTPGADDVVVRIKSEVAAVEARLA